MSPPLAVTDSQAVTATRAVVAPKEGFTAIPNAILDNLLPQLKPEEQLVYIRLWRLTIGHQRETCLVSMPTLARTLNLSERTILRAVNALESRGLILRERAVFKAPNASRGNLYRLLPVEGVPARQSVTARRTATDSVAVMKDIERKKHEKAPSAPATKRVTPADNSLDTELGIDRRIVALTQLVATYKASHPAADVGELRERIRRMVEHERWTDFDDARIDEIARAVTE